MPATGGGLSMPLPNIGQRAARLTGAAIARDAQRYEGQGYVYGGNASSPGDWDCSSFVSYVLGHDLRLSLPGGQWGAPGFPPNDHGPVVTSYADWTGADTVGTPQAGDLCCFVGLGPNGHIGIAVSSGEMVSALNPSKGTVKTPIAGYGPAGAPLIYRRVNGLAGLLPAPPSGSPTSAHPPVMVAVVVAGLFVGAFVLLAVAAGLVVPGVVWAGRKMAA